ncbi:MAG: hypothetical protein VKJ04_06855 [Vampirovibrionales bacterium]|nr:hypothetical protein [Vampirovibrionales bacterium]
MSLGSQPAAGTPVQQMPFSPSTDAATSSTNSPYSSPIVADPFASNDSVSLGEKKKRPWGAIIGGSTLATLAVLAGVARHNTKPIREAGGELAEKIKWYDLRNAFSGEAKIKARYAPEAEKTVPEAGETVEKAADTVSAPTVQTLPEVPYGLRTLRLATSQGIQPESLADVLTHARLPQTASPVQIAQALGLPANPSATAISHKLRIIPNLDFRAGLVDDLLSRFGHNTDTIAVQTRLEKSNLPMLPKWTQNLADGEQLVRIEHNGYAFWATKTDIESGKAFNYRNTAKKFSHQDITLNAGDKFPIIENSPQPKIVGEYTVPASTSAPPSGGSSGPTGGAFTGPGGRAAGPGTPPAPASSGRERVADAIKDIPGLGWLARRLRNS